MKLALMKTALLVFGMGLCVSALSGEEQSSEKAVEPEVTFASAVAKKVDRDESAWQELTVKLAKAVESYNPASLHVMPEIQTLEAFRTYCAKLLESGRELVSLHEKWNKASVGLGDSLKKAPAYYRAASQTMRT